jgi:ABC-type uncharacterized transport system substrate-binding protein
LISYGPDQIDPYRRAAEYVDRILKGEKPSELPIQAPTKFELVINLKAAKALGFANPTHARRPCRRGDRIGSDFTVHTAVAQGRSCALPLPEVLDL